MAEAILDRPAVASASVRRISWGAIIAGAVLALVIQFMLALLGVGIGLSTLDPAGNGSPSVTALTSGGGLWTLAAVLVATFFGAFAAARLAGSPARLDGLLHGIVTWASSTLIIVYLLTTGASAVIGGTFGALGGSVGALTSAAKSLTPNSLSALPDGLEGDVRQLLQRGEQQVNQAADQAQQQGEQAVQQARQATGEADLTKAVPQIVAGLGQDAKPEQRQAAVAVISQQAGIPQAEAEQRLTQFQQRYDQAVAKAKQAAGEAAKVVSKTAFATFVVLLLGLIVGAIGGAIGRPKPVIGVARF